MHYVESLSEQAAPDERLRFEEWLVDRACTIAEAAGGFLGLTLANLRRRAEND